MRHNYYNHRYPRIVIRDEAIETGTEDYLLHRMQKELIKGFAGAVLGVACLVGVVHEWHDAKAISDALPASAVATAPDRPKYEAQCKNIAKHGYTSLSIKACTDQETHWSLVHANPEYKEHIVGLGLSFAGAALGLLFNLVSRSYYDMADDRLKKLKKQNQMQPAQQTQAPK